MDYSLESPSTTAIAKALASAQKDVEAPKKKHTAKVPTKDGKSYEYHYAALDDIIDCLKAPFAKYGLSQSQAMLPSDGHVLLVTTIRHESGEWIRSYFPIRIYDRPQETGSAISYGRRYSLQALAGIMAEDDDDGKAAQDAKPALASAKKEKAAPPPTPGVEVPPVAIISRDEALEVHAAAKRAGVATLEALEPILENICGVPRARLIPRAELPNVFDELAKLADHREAPAPDYLR